MVPLICRVDSIGLARADAGLNSPRDLYDVTLTYGALGTSATYRCTHVPPAAVAALQQVGQCEVHLVALDVNGLASHLLPGRPQFIVTGLSPLAGKPTAVLPRVLRSARRGGLLAAASAMAVGLGVAALGWGLLGALLASAGALAYRTVSSVPGRSFWGHEDELPEDRRLLPQG